MRRSDAPRRGTRHLQWRRVAVGVHSVLQTKILGFDPSRFCFCRDKRTPSHFSTRGFLLRRFLLLPATIRHYHSYRTRRREHKNVTPHGHREYLNRVYPCQVSASASARERGDACGSRAGSSCWESPLQILPSLVGATGHSAETWELLTKRA